MKAKSKVPRKSGKATAGVRLVECRRWVAGIDLAGAADHYVCGPRNDEGTHDIAHFPGDTPGLRAMAAWLKERRVESVAMESTGVYWVPVAAVLEAAGLEVALVDTRTVKMVPGRKSDVQDCQWLQHLHSCGLLRGAYRPPEEFSGLRALWRERASFVAVRTQFVQMAHKACDRMNVRIHRAVTDVLGLTGMRILEAIATGVRDPAALATLRDKRCKLSVAEFVRELTGTWNPDDLFVLENAWRTIQSLDETIAAFDERIRATAAALAATRPEPPEPAASVLPSDPALRRVQLLKDRRDAPAKADLARLCGGFDMTRIPGVEYATACRFLAEIGPSLHAFPTEKHFVSYLGLAPALGKSAGKNVRSKRKGRSVHPAGLVLRQAASTLSANKSELGSRYRAVRARAGATAANRDCAREIAKRIYRGLKFGQVYVAKGQEAHAARDRKKRFDRTLRHLKRLDLTPEERALVVQTVA